MFEILQTLQAFTDIVVVVTVKAWKGYHTIDVLIDLEQGSCRFPSSSQVLNGLCWREIREERTTYNNGRSKTKTEVPNDTSFNIYDRGWILYINDGFLFFTKNE